jgi:hypothetical protein
LSRPRRPRAGSSPPRHDGCRPAPPDRWSGGFGVRFPSGTPGHRPAQRACSASTAPADSNSPSRKLLVEVVKPSHAGDGPDCVRTACAAATLPLRSRAAARLWAAGHAPARGNGATSSSGHPRWPQIVLHDREESTPLRAPIPPGLRWQDTCRFSPWSSGGIGGPGLTPRDHAKRRPGPRDGERRAAQHGLKNQPAL